MEGQNLPMSIRDFEIQTVRRFLDKERPRDERGFGNYGESRPPRSELTPSDRYNKSVDVVLQSIGLDRFVSNFKEHDVGVNIMIHMNEDDLAEIGITDIMDQILFKKQLNDFRGTKGRGQRSVYRPEEDLIMARNVLAHLEDINAHLEVVQNFLKKYDYEDYYISPRKSILAVFNIVANQALIQTKKMSDVLFTGSLDSDELIPALLNINSLDLPEFMVLKLYHPDKSFKPKAKKAKPSMKSARTLLILGVGLGATVMVAFYCRSWFRK